LVSAIVTCCFFTGMSIKSDWETLKDRPMLLVNQVGYYPDAPKRVIYQVPGENVTVPAEANFDIINAQTGIVEYSGKLVDINISRYGHTYMVGEFSDFNKTGDYFISACIDGQNLKSYDFKISDDIYDTAIRRALRFFYYQRCNYEVQEVVKGYPGHHACHIDDGEVWNGTDWVHEDLTGGWHDAGDYNKYNSWFQTQWYCTQGLAESALIDPRGVFNNTEDLYDSDLPDVVDEALWGAKFLINCINEDGLQGEEYRWMVWETVSGYRHDTDHEARMSYWGPPELDWTTPRRVVFNEHNSTFVYWGRGYAIAATLLQIARMIDEYTARFPNVQLPKWAEKNTTRIRFLADQVYNKYHSFENNIGIQEYIGKFFYLEEKWLLGEVNASELDDLVNEVIPKIYPYSNMNSWAYWFGWAGEYLLGNILLHYLTYNRIIPGIVLDKVQAMQENHFKILFPEPFKVKHSITNGSIHLFYGAERQTDMMTSAWLQSLFTRVNATAGKPDIIQSYIDWLCGVNPFNVCLIESVGEVNIPQYHHRYSYARNPRGAVPGAIPNGIAPTQVTDEWAFDHSFSENTDDEYFNRSVNDPSIPFDNGWIADWPGNPIIRDGVPSNPNEVWIPHDAMFLRLMVSIEAGDIFA
ncbi:MAG: glycoside hydrolase family 9 protein, partial [Promethearchaeota archaeon]